MQDNHRVLIVVDVQNGFLPCGNLAIPHSDTIIPVINRLVPLFSNLIVTQDWHPEGHHSFASSHNGKKPGDIIELSYGSQVLWPDHCIQGTSDAQLCPDAHIEHAQLIIRKGYHKEIDSYSAFMEADRKTSTGLAGYLHDRGIKHCYICGLATDFCVAWTALDARKLGFDVTVIEDACYGIDLNGSLERAWKDMEFAKIERVQSANLMQKSIK